MESLDTPTPTTQPYSDSHNSPVDPALFNNKRDSAYSSFSASSNTSDYATVPLRPGEACSMDNLLQSMGPSYRGYTSADTSAMGNTSAEASEEAQFIMHKTRSLTRSRPRPVEVKERPSSCCYEEERRGGGFEIVRNGEREAERKVNPPQPPTRKDSFRATRSRPSVNSKRCVSAPVEITSAPCYYEKDKSSLNPESGIHNGFLPQDDGDKTRNFKEDTVDSHYVRRQTKDSRPVKCETGAKKDTNHLTDTTACLDPNTSSHPGGSLLVETSTEIQRQPHTPSDLQTKASSMALHRHSAPEKLLATQLQLLQFSSDSSSTEHYNPSNPSDGSVSPCSSQWSQSSLQPTREDQEASHNHLHAPSSKWGDSRCSTPGSVFLEGDDDDGSPRERQEVMGVNGRLTPTEPHHHWGRSVSVPGDPTGSSAQGRLTSDLILERDFTPLSAAASMDTLLEERRTETKEKVGAKAEGMDGQTEVKKLNSPRNRRNRRNRNERFATNLRNEIQRKKAQLQRSRGPGGLLCSGETVQEEEGPDLSEEQGGSDLPAQQRNTKVLFTAPVIIQDTSATAQVEKSSTSSETNQDASQTQSTAYTENSSVSTSVQILDPGVPSFGVGIRVVEEPAPAGKARRWRWTPEHKLQPDPEPDRRCGAVGERVLGVTRSRHGVCGYTSSSTSSYGRSSSCSRMEESDILPFADRMKFFEETSKGVPASNMSSRRQKKAPQHPELHPAELSQHLAQRRYSYQGGLQQETPLPSNTMEARRLSVSTGRERQKEREREKEREIEERAREREERLKERQERELEMERAKMREIQREREREESVRQWERERERERQLELEREKEMERAREKERLRKEMEKELEREREREKEREEDAQLASHQDFYRSSGITDRNQDFQHKDNFHSFQPKTFSHSQAQNQVQRSAFYPVSAPSQPLDNQQPHQGYTTRSYTPTEVWGPSFTTTTVTKIS